ncbi:feruloyl esterase B [Colletotrichum tofieldiae]|nr:feruloyl esterase B [Colletotrichum tofieldiae]
MVLSPTLTLLTQMVLGVPKIISNNSPQVACDALTLPQFDDFDITSTEAYEVHNYTSTSDPLEFAASFCNLTVTLNHHNADDVVFVNIWLPLKKWNGRFLATGGGGFAAGIFAAALADPVFKGYAAGSTDAGATLNHTIDAGTGHWILRPDNSINKVLVENFATRSIHDMGLIGKAAVKAFYGTNAHHSYFSGCSQGGRQGYFSAQYDPGDFDGILANAPAINMQRLAPALYWPSVVMNNIAVPPQCVFDEYQKAIIAQCDPQDGAQDGLISAPEKCAYDATRLTGHTINCSDTERVITITEDDAEVVSRVLKGSRKDSKEFLWYGTPPGATFKGLSNTKIEDGVIKPAPFEPAKSWMSHFIAQDPKFDTTSLTFADFEEFFIQSVEKYTEPFGSEDPDLTEFKRAGGKLLTWHGLTDELINHLGSTLFWDRLQKKMGGPDSLESFYRLFLAPGVGHCGGGYGPVPVEPLSVLVDWVENGKAPNILFATTAPHDGNTSRDLCAYPQKIRYKGQGDVRDASSFECTL